MPTKRTVGPRAESANRPTAGAKGKPANNPPVSSNASGPYFDPQMGDEAGPWFPFFEVQDELEGRFGWGRARATQWIGRQGAAGKISVRILERYLPHAHPASRSHLEWRRAAVPMPPRLPDNVFFDLEPSERFPLGGARLVKVNPPLPAGCRPDDDHVSLREWLAQHPDEVFATWLQRHSECHRAQLEALMEAERQPPVALVQGASPTTPAKHKAGRHLDPDWQYVVAKLQPLLAASGGTMPAPELDNYVCEFAEERGRGRPAKWTVQRLRKAAVDRWKRDNNKQ